jgi:hypothetical protein
VLDVDKMIDLRLVHEIHTSERHSFRGCRRRWDWLFNQNYYPLVTPKYFEFGTAFHAGMEKYYDPGAWKFPRDVAANLAIMEFVKVCEEQKQDAIKVGQKLYLDDDIEADYEERVELGKGMLRYFFEKVAPKEDHGWKPVKVEIAFMLPIPNVETGEEYIWCKCDRCWTTWRTFLNKPWDDPDSSPMEVFRAISNGYGEIDSPEARAKWQGLPVVYAGRIDMLIQDEKGHYWIVDWKTAAQIRGDDEFLYLDDQIGSYVWALRKFGLDVKGFIYHIQRKAYPQPPQKNKVRRLGRLYSVNQNQATNYEEYKATVEVEDKEAYDAGLYDEFLAFLKDEGTVFYSRHQIHKTYHEVQEIERNISLEALTMCDPNIRIYPESGRFGCTSCAFRQPCLGKNAGEDYLYTLDTLFEKREHYYLRKRPSTDSRGGE